MVYSNKIGRGHGFARIIKQSIYIRVNQATLNRNIGTYNISYICDGVLINTPELQIKHLWDYPEHLEV